MANVITDSYALYNNDCIEGMMGLPENSIDLVVYSPPFRGLYHYSSDPRDMSNCDSKAQFIEHYDFLVKQLTRVTKPGRCNAVHCREVPLTTSGKDDLEDLPGIITEVYRNNGWRYVGHHSIWKEPLQIRLKTMQKSLAHKTICDDSMDAGIVTNDEVLIFIKGGQNKVPVSNETGFMYYPGETPIPKEVMQFKGFKGDQKQNRFSQWIWRQLASGVWDDIRFNRVLEYKPARDKEDESHVHPLMLDVIERVIMMRSNPGETVLTPFMGVGSEVYGAVSLGRRGVGFELKETYFRQAVKNLESCVPVEINDTQQLTLI